MPLCFPPYEAIYQQTLQRIAAGVFEAMVKGLRLILRMAAGKEPIPSAAIMDSGTLQSTPESGHRGSDDGGKRKKGSNRAW